MVYNKTKCWYYERNLGHDNCISLRIGLSNRFHFAAYDTSRAHARLMLTTSSSCSRPAQQWTVLQIFILSLLLFI